MGFLLVQRRRQQRVDLSLERRNGVIVLETMSGVAREVPGVWGQRKPGSIGDISGSYRRTG